MIRIPVFRIFYSTTFTILFLLTLALLAVSPFDGIFQSFRNGQRLSIIIIAGVYLLTLVVTLFIYATRLYTTRSHLAAIPKTRLPLQKGDLPGVVRRLVLSDIERSASVAFKAKPRDLTDESRGLSETAEQDGEQRSEPLPTWGTISHAGWSAPHDPEMPNMRYNSILQELPHLLEARAVSLAPEDPDSIEQVAASRLADEVQPQHSADPLAVALLQRPRSAPLRAYIAQLVELGVLQSTEQAADFLARYEAIRFSAKPVYEQDFHDLMDMFAHMLDRMQEPDSDVLKGFAGLADARSVSNESSHNAPSDDDVFAAGPIMVNLPPLERRLSRGRLAPPPLDFSRTRSTSGQSNNSAQSENQGSTSAVSSMTPYFTPYPEPHSAKTASTGSLAGSEGTAETAPSRLPRRSPSGMRTPSAYSRRSSRPYTGPRKPSKGSFGLGLNIDEGNSVGLESKSEGSHSRSPFSRDDENREPSEDEGSVRRYNVHPEADSDDIAELSHSESIDSGGSVVRKRPKSQPGLLSPG